MMAIMRDIKNVSDRSYKNDEAPHGGLAQSKYREERMEVVKGPFFNNIFGYIHRVVYKGTSEAQ